MTDAVRGVGTARCGPVWRCASLIAITAAALGAALPAMAQDPRARLASELVVEVRVHGNYSLSDEEVLQIAAVEVGDRVTTADRAAIAQRLLDSGRFATVEVLRRYRSLTPTDRVQLILSVQQKTSTGDKLLLMPELQYNENEKLSIGARIAAKSLFGGGELISVPLTYGGVDQLAVEVTRDWDSGYRVGGSVGARRFENPHARLDDARLHAAAFIERNLTDTLQLRFDGEIADVDFGGLDETLWTYGAGVRFDTRLNLSFPYDAVVVGARWQRLDPATGVSANRLRFELAAYKTIVGQLVLAARAVLHTADAPLPVYERPYVGGMVSLRGYRAGALGGDNAIFGGAELRLPVTTSFSVARLGFTAFWDIGTAYPYGLPMARAQFENGVGAGVFLVAPLVRLNLDVANNLEGDTRVHFGLGFRF